MREQGGKLEKETIERNVCLMSKIISGNVIKKMKILSQSESTSDLTNKLCLSQGKRKNISSAKLLK